MTNKLEQLARRYEELTHAVQSGIAMLMNSPEYKGTQPKHMRVGIDMSKSDMGGLAKLLISKGVFTEEEYYEVMVEFAEREVREFEGRVSRMLGRNVTLG
jgi:hypothetical protein